MKASTCGAIDFYPSRGPEPRWLARREPVVHPPVDEANASPLEAEDLARYAEQGFLVVEGLFSSDEVRTLLEDGRRAIAQTPDDDEAVVREPGGDSIRSIFAIDRRGAALAALCGDPRLVARAGQILGSGLYIHQSRLNFKPGFEGKEFWWHSDFETWHVEDGMPAMRALSCSVLLSDNTASNGPLLVIPGSHRRFLACVGQAPAEHYRHSLKRQEYGVPDRSTLTDLSQVNGIVPIIGKAGSAVFFDCNLLHGSAGNITPMPRINAFIVYNSLENRLIAPFGGMPPRPWYLASRDGAQVGWRGEDAR